MHLSTPRSTRFAHSWRAKTASASPPSAATRALCVAISRRPWTATAGASRASGRRAGRRASDGAPARVEAARSRWVGRKSRPTVRAGLLQTASAATRASPPLRHARPRTRRRAATAMSPSSARRHGARAWTSRRPGGRASLIHWRLKTDSLSCVAGFPRTLDGLGRSLTSLRASVASEPFSVWTGQRYQWSGSIRSSRCGPQWLPDF